MKQYVSRNCEWNKYTFNTFKYNSTQDRIQLCLIEDLDTRLSAIDRQ